VPTIVGVEPLDSETTVLSEVDVEAGLAPGCLDVQLVTSVVDDDDVEGDTVNSVVC